MTAVVVVEMEVDGEIGPDISLAISKRISITTYLNSKKEVVCKERKK